MIVIEDMQDASVSMGEGMGEYKVEKNETLMMIAFKIYGDYSKWKMLADQNQGILKNGVVMAGSKISYQMPSQTFNWSPEGNPYLIKSGDTLGTISSDVYGTTKKWKLLWDNNKPLIKDPNRIFAGFTIYWTEQGKVASSENQFEL
jgi:nucleoid-associated protein YgaU